MHETIDKTIEKIYIIQPITRENASKYKVLHEEAISLIESAGALYAGTIYQNVREINPATFVGEGKLAELYERGAYTPLEREHYIDLVVKALTLLPPETVIARLTGDGMGADLLAPDWSRKKVSVINDIDKRLYALDLWQGKYFE